MKTLPLLLVALTLSGCGEGRDASEPVERLHEMARDALSQIDGEIPLPGLQQDVEVLRDEVGIAHIYAGNTEDLFFAQGFVAAQDRLWEMDVWRRYAEGRAAEIVGPDRFETDRLYRLLSYGGSRAADFDSYHPDAERIFTAYAAGVNAYIDRVGDRLPIEFQITGTRPDRWTADLSALRLVQRAVARARDEVRLARDVVEKGAEEANRSRTPDPYVPLRIPEGLDIQAVAEQADAIIAALSGNFDQILRPPVLPEYRLAARNATAAAAGGVAGRLSLATLLERPGVHVPAALREEPGSNNWVLSPSMTTTGGVILANDPHRQVTNPSLRYIVHLNAPGWNVIGSGEPSLPGVAIGHNDRVAWGLTIVGTDQDDLYQERVNPDDPNQVLWRGEWEALRVIVDTIDVLGEAPRVVELKYSRHGPIVYEDPENQYAYALRTVLSEPGTAHYMGALRVDQVRNCREFLEAMDYWKAPSENMICGDVDGNIAWKASALTPDRGGLWHGRLPVPGTGEYEWRGFRDDLPEEYNPARGWIATANHNIQPESFSPPIMFKAPPYLRYERLASVLSTSLPLSMEDNVRLQLDAYHLQAAEAAPLFDGWSSDDPGVERARRLLTQWNHVFSEESAGAALYYTWSRMLDREAPDASIPDSVPRETVERALRMAVDSLTAEQGSDADTWRWGRSNRVPFDHPLSAAFDLPTVERGGDAGTVSANGGTYKEILDVSKWDASLVINAPGQSGQPESPYYANLLEAWADGEYFPYVFTRESVDAHARHRLTLVPGR